MTITHFNENTPDEVKRILLERQQSRERLRLFFGDVATGKAWPEENDVIGRISNSTGPEKIAILVHNERSMGGGAILTHCIVAIRRVGGGWLYKHPDFHTGEWGIDEEQADIAWKFIVTHNGKEHARFKSRRSARNFLSFITGERFSK